MIKFFQIILVCFLFLGAQTSKEIKGNYLLVAQISKAKTLTQKLTIKKNGYTLFSQNPFKGDYTETGSWTISNDTLVLIGEERKTKQNKDSNYNNNYRKNDFEYSKKEKFLVYDNQLCSIHVIQKGEGYCFMRK